MALLEPVNCGTGRAHAIREVAAPLPWRQISRVPDTPPTTIGKYQLTDLLGQGAMGVVYRALDPLLNRYVAVKLMGQSLASDTNLRDRFMREAQAAGSLQHPNIITIFDFGEVDGHLFIAMEYIEGSDLSEMMERRDPLTLPAKLDIMIDVLHALEYAHTRRVVHRDIKPANIRVGVDGRAKLMDFGIARLESSELTKTGMLIGTPNYMAPEQVNSGQVSAATDIFSLGAVLYEFVSYQKTFGGDTLHAVLFKVVSEQPKPLSTIVPGIPKELERIVNKALAKDPLDRYAHAGLMAQDLSAVRTALSGGGGVTIAARRTPLMTTAAPEPPARPARARRSALIGGIAAVVILAGAAVALVARRQTPGPASAASATVVASDAPAPRTDTAPQPSAGGATVQAPALSRPEPGAARTAERAAAATTSGSGPASGAARSTDTPSVSAPVPAPPSASAATAPPPQATAPVPQQTALPSPPPAAAAPAPPAPPAPPADPRPEIEQLVATYARAIESRSVAEIRRVYPGLTGTQQQSWEQFFQSVRSVRARLGITRLDVGEGTAELAVSGGYDYDAGTGRTQHQDVTFRATAAQEGGAWKLRTVR